MNNSATKAATKNVTRGKAKSAPRKSAKKSAPRKSAKVARAAKSAPAKTQGARRSPVSAVRPLLSTEAARMKPIRLATERPPSYDAHAATERVVQVLGKSGTAAVLGVSKAQPGRWLSCEEGMSPQHQTAIKELDSFLNLVLNAFTPEQAAIWLFSTNSFLGSATPMDVFRLQGLTAVTPAISGFQQGVYA